jgi:ectoine hydroxylase
MTHQTASAAPSDAIIRAAYEQQGWCRLDYRLADTEIAKLRASVQRCLSERDREIVYEEGSKAVRAIHGCHRFDQVCSDLTRLPQLVDVAEGLLGSQAYVYQFKVNLKQPKDGAAWPWHQDFPYWKLEDGMPEPHAVNIAILLDDAHEGNGPLVVIPGSHRLGLISAPEQRKERPAADWRPLFASALPYTVASEVASRLAGERGTKPLDGSAGTIYVFHPMLVHSSSRNLSADRRALLIISYNAVNNSPPYPRRPEFLVDPDNSPITRLSRETL